MPYIPSTINVFAAKREISFQAQSKVDSSLYRDSYASIISCGVKPRIRNYSILPPRLKESLTLRCETWKRSLISAYRMLPQWCNSKVSDFPETSETRRDQTGLRAWILLLRESDVNFAKFAGTSEIVSIGFSSDEFSPAREDGGEFLGASLRLVYAQSFREYRCS